MDAKTFNAQVDDFLLPILESSGFKQVKTCFNREDGIGQLILLRYGGSKFSSACQFTRFMLCFRHMFLRDVGEKIPESLTILDQVSSYPFRTKPSELNVKQIASWQYHFKLNPEEYDEICYGEMTDARKVLTQMGERIISHGIEWAKRLTPEEAFKQLLADNSESFVCKLWVADYEKNRETRTIR